MVTGSGQIVLQNAACVSAQIVGAAGAVLTLGADQTLHGYGQIGMDVVNQGQIEGDVNGGTLTFLQSLANTGTVSTVGGGNLSLSKALLNSGAVAATGSGNLTVSGQTVNTGTLEASSGATLNIDGPFTTDGSGILVGQASGTITISGNLLGNTQNADQYAPLATVQFNGSGSVASPQLLGSDEPRPRQ